MTDTSRQAVIVSAVRTPIGRFLGGLSSLSAPDLGGIAIRAAVERAGIDAKDIEEVIMGNVIQGGVGQAPARQAALKGGLPAEVSCLTINKVCGSGLNAVMLAAQAIKAGDRQVFVAGGQESMSNAPYYNYGMRGGVKLGDQTIVDGMIKDGLWCSFCDVHMGTHAEYTAKKASVTRQMQDEFAAKSHAKAVAAMDAGKFKNEIVAVQIPGKKVQDLTLLSGGERALVSAALLFALLETNPPPFCLLDEVDAALDESNVVRFCEILKALSEQTQFIMITHNRMAMTFADAIYGTSMQADSITRVVSMKLAEVASIR